MPGIDRGVKETGMNFMPGRFLELRVWVSFSALMYGAPRVRKGSVVPRPSEA